MRERGLSVEFLGLPGAGKSTLSHRVAAILCERGTPADQPSYVLAHGLGRISRIVKKSVRVLREALLSPRYALLAVKAVASTRQRRHRDYLKMIFNWLLVSSLMRRRRPDGRIDLYDQGIFQALWSIGFGGEEGAVDVMMERVAHRVPLPMVVTIVEASLTTLQRRLDVRPEFDSRLDVRSPDDAESLTRSARVFESVRRVLLEISRSRPDMRLLVIDNDSDDGLETNATRIAADLERILNERLGEDRAPGGRRGVEKGCADDRGRSIL